MEAYGQVTTGYWPAVLTGAVLLLTFIVSMTAAVMRRRRPHRKHTTVEPAVRPFGAPPSDVEVPVGRCRGLIAEALIVRDRLSGQIDAETYQARMKDLVSQTVDEGCVVHRESVPAAEECVMSIVDVVVVVVGGRGHRRAGLVLLRPAPGPRRASDRRRATCPGYRSGRLQPERHPGPPGRPGGDRVRSAGNRGLQLAGGVPRPAAVSGAAAHTSARRCGSLRSRRGRSGSPAV